MHGWIILDKPSGMTSAHAVAKVKKLLSAPSLTLPRTRERGIKIGHAGTLDPLASGVLPLALGEATKTVAYMMDAAKAYEFTVTWGEERDTDDSQGQVTQTSLQRPSKADIEAILPDFTGRIQQTPPSYSAIKVDGQRAYALAREGEVVELKAREVVVKSLELMDYDGQKDNFLCHCGKGTYIRSIARDMGRKIGCLGHISRLRRIRVGKFDQTQAISLEVLTEMRHKGDLGFLRTVESALDDILARTIDANQALQLKRGQTVILPREEPVGTMVSARCDGKLVAICEVAGRSMKPVRVFNID